MSGLLALLITWACWQVFRLGWSLKS